MAHGKYCPLKPQSEATNTTAAYHCADAKRASGKRERAGCASRERALTKDVDEYSPGRNARADVERLRGTGNELVEKRVGRIQPASGILNDLAMVCASQQTQ